MSKDTMAFAYGAAQKYAYAGAFAIQTSPITYNEEDGMEALFLTSDGGQTTWPCDALYFDDAEHAFAKKFALRLPQIKGPDGEAYPRVVHIALMCDIKAVSIAVSQDATQAQTQERVA